jgi:hypothetical protein
MTSEATGGEEPPSSEKLTTTKAGAGEEEVEDSTAEEGNAREADIDVPSDWNSTACTFL